MASITARRSQQQLVADVGFVVVRSFDLKQHWIPHSKFKDMTISNWTRRPGSQIYLQAVVSAHCSASAVEKLAAFGTRWIKNHPKVNQKNYMKCAVTGLRHGYQLEIVFATCYPYVSKTKVRQDFVLAFLGAAEKLQVPLVPGDFAFHSPPDGSRDAASVELQAQRKEVDLSDLLPGSST